MPDSPIQPGRTLSHYQVLEKLGEGGMGVVYKARDSQLGRFVALKVLPADALRSEDRKRRFIQEARAASALNHPNIITIYEIAETEGVDFIAMEFVTRKPLDQLVGRKGLPLSETLKYAAQIAGALARAHAAGIIHRDLKPANIMVAGDGLVKVLDFGLAKLTGPSEAGESEETATLAASLQTEEGAIVGTAAYMSPEQAEGRKLDARSDIFSFGAVLYEMATGRRAFQRDSRIATLSAVLRDEPPPVGEIAELDRILTRCLRKNPDRRFQHMDDVKVALEELQDESASGKLGAVQPKRRHRKWRTIVAVAAAVHGIAAGVWLYRSRAGKPAAALQTVPLTAYAGSEIEPTFSPDGSQVAFAWNGERQDNFAIYVKSIGPGTPLGLTNHAGQERSPAWSPDGRWIAFIRFREPGKAEVVMIPALGGAERRLASVEGGYPCPPGVECPFLAWSPDSAWLAGSNLRLPRQRGLCLLSIATGEIRQLTDGPNDRAPAFSPDGRTLAFARAPAPGLSELYTLALSDSLMPRGEPKRLTYQNQWSISPVWTPDGSEIIFSSGEMNGLRRLWRISATGPPGAPQPVPGAGEDAQTVVISRGARLGGRATPPHLVYTRSLFDSNIWGIDLSSAGAPAGPPRPVIASTARDLYPHLSPDGRRIAFSSDRSGSMEIWIADRDGSNAMQLTTFGQGSSQNPCWSPDGERIALASRSGGKVQVWLIGVSGGTPELLTGDFQTAGTPAWSADGKWIYVTVTDSYPFQVWKVAARPPRKPGQFTRNGGSLPQPSPDGKFVYYLGMPRADLRRMSVDGQGDPVTEEIVPLPPLYAQSSFAVTRRGVWFFPGGQSHLQFLDVQSGKIHPITRLERPLYFGLAVSPDERHVLWSQIDQLGSDLMLVENFR